MFRPKTSSSSSRAKAQQHVYGVLPSTFTDGLPLPKLFIFDLDYTLWPFWVDTHVSPPLKAVDGGLRVKDSLGESFAFYDDVNSILPALRQLKIKIAAASRTDAPDMARDMLKQLKAPEHAAPEPSAGGGSNSYSNNNNNSSNGGGGGGGGAVPLIKAIEFFDTVQIFPGSKTVHLEKIRGATGVRYEEMLFFDDESRNRDTERLGVVMWLVREGLSNDEVDMGVLSWRKRNRRQLE